jgi:succinate dehydrogenase / fumarate reductase cytochrome b subunit
MCFGLLKSSIGKKQIVAITGLLLIFYLIAHLAGNLFIYLGPAAFNRYAQTLAGLRPGLYLIEIGLLFVFLIHIFVTTLLILENIRSAGVTRYKVSNSKSDRPWSTRLRVYTGLFIFAFVIYHLLDFTFSDRTGVRSMIGHKSYGLYGVVYNSFLNPVHSIIYIVAMFCVGFHLAHGVQSCMQSFGFNHPKYSPMMKTASNWLGFLIAFGFSSIPVYVMLNGAR